MSTITIDPDSRTGRAVVTVRDYLANVEPDKLLRLDETLAIDQEEHTRYQRLRADCYVNELIQYEDSHAMRQALGDQLNTANGGWADGVDTATKYTLTLAFTALLKRRLGVA